MSEPFQRKEVAYRRLIDAARSLSSAVDVDELVASILASSREVMHCQACSICLPDPATGDLLIRGTQQELRNKILRVPAGKGIAGRVFRTRRAEHTVDAQTDSDHYSGIGIETNVTAHAMLTIPLEDRQICLGVMQALNPTDRDRFDAFDEEVFGAFGSLIATTLTRIREQEAATKKEIEEAYRKAELSIARNAQFSFMPAPVFETTDFHIAVFQEQAADIGGDFYTYLELSDGSLLVAVGDATGKGIPAALESARVCTLISLKAPSCTRERFPVWLAELNALLYATAERARSLTSLVLLLFDRGNRRLHACSFGQVRPRYLSFINEWKELPCEVYPPLGATISHSISVYRIPLAFGSQWLLLSDGITEAQNAAREQFGEQALQECLGQELGGALLAAPEAASIFLSRLENNWREFHRNGPDPDDATALVVTDKLARPAGSYACQIGAETIPELRSFCEQWIAFIGFGEEGNYNLLLACDELFTNIYKHAYHSGSGPVGCDAAFDAESLAFTIIHQGEGFDPNAVQSVQRPSSKPGGYGIPFIRKVFDEVSFETRDNSSRVTLKKLLPL
jgi:phosphoserine phosphatase RsbU/P